jgi:hypothetical protein
MRDHNPIDVFIALTLGVATIALVAIFDLKAEPKQQQQLLPAAVVIHDDPNSIPIAELSVRKLRKLTIQHQVGPVRLRQSGRRADLLEALLDAGVSCA